VEQGYPASQVASFSQLPPLQCKPCVIKDLPISDPSTGDGLPELYEFNPIGRPFHWLLIKVSPIAG